MPSIQQSTNSSSSASPSDEDPLYYKAQYEQLEAELADFQASSRELETELERDVEAAEKRERQLQEKIESLGYEVEEWKTKYKQSKAEANNAQNSLEKEITALRDSNRTMQLKLRDIEVANDDFEKQARNTTSSLEDLESKYNMAIERGVMFEEEIKVGENEREALRIETQRLRDELGELRVEADVRQDKLRRAEAATEQHHRKKLADFDASLNNTTYKVRLVHRVGNSDSSITTNIRSFYAGSTYGVTSCIQTKALDIRHNHKAQTAIFVQDSEVFQGSISNDSAGTGDTILFRKNNSY
ncbi:MAG: hypothetical protein Q9207_002832 [Kuettlingeria erythrocarpa]